MSAPRRCALIACEAAGTAYPVLLMTFKGYDGKPVEAVMGMTVCWQHQIGKVAEDFISDEGWQQIVDTFVATQRVLPDRELTTLRWLPVDEYRGPALRMSEDRA